MNSQSLSPAAGKRCIQWQHPSPLIITLGVVIFLSPHLACATDYVAGFDIRTTAKHDNNINMSKTEKSPVSGILVAPALTLDANTETTSVSLRGGLSSSRYDDSDFNTNDRNLSLTINQQMEKNSFSLSLVDVRDSTLTSEITDSGRLGNKADKHEQYRVSPEWDYVLNEQDTLKFRGSYSVDDYASTGYFGYTYWDTSADWVHTLTERLQFVTRLLHSDYESDYRTTIFLLPIFPPKIGELGYATQTRSSGLQLGMYYALSERNSLNVLLGQSKSTTEYLVKDLTSLCDSVYASSVALCDTSATKENLSTARIDWNWTAEKQRVSVSGSREVQPSSNGRALRSLQVTANWSYNLSERDKLSSALILVSNRALNDSSNSSDARASNRDYRAVTLAYNRQLSESWSVDTSYSYRTQDYIDYDDYRTNSSVIAVGIRYIPNQWHWSR